MGHNSDDESDFLGVTYIAHDHRRGEQKHKTNAHHIKEPKKSEEHAYADAAEIEALQKELERIESRLQTYRLETDERLSHLERLAGHPLSPEEKVFRIQEDA